MKKIIMVVIALLTFIFIKSYAQIDYTIHGNIDISHSRDNLFQSLQTPYTEPDLSSAQRIADIVNKQYAEMLKRGIGKYEQQDKVLVSNSQYYSTWNYQTKAWDDSPNYHDTWYFYLQDRSIKIVSPKTNDVLLITDVNPKNENNCYDANMLCYSSSYHRYCEFTVSNCNLGVYTGAFVSIKFFGKDGKICSTCVYIIQ